MRFHKFGILTLEKVAPIYGEYFQNVLDVYQGKGWYERHNLSFLERQLPNKYNL